MNGVTIAVTTAPMAMAGVPSSEVLIVCLVSSDPLRARAARATAADGLS
ncbi:hypothetical protein GCM10011354_19780 [Egicoccus halophilus]|uniref:Uncharacterized protein n=1 Tax=Egicoccus halophilus TaxID=1670830 RepID=A0A8J3AE18_9ACTN|nr:hypothetical protein GCM10011354_19780 [Egicoccus halophilus]